MTSKNNRALLLYYVKLCASFQIHWWIQTGVTVQKLTLNSGHNCRYFNLCDLEICCMTLENNRALLPYHIKLCASFQSHRWSQTSVTIRKRSIRVKISNFFSRATLRFNGWPWKTIGHLCYAASSFVHHFIDIGEFKMELQSGNAQFGSKSMIFLAVWPWNLTNDIENNRAPFLSKIKLCASFQRHMWIQTGVTVRKRLSGVMTSGTLTFDLWPWPFAWTSLLSMVITPENCVMIRWQGHGEKGVTDRRTDRQTDRQTVDVQIWKWLSLTFGIREAHNWKGTFGDLR